MFGRRRATAEELAQGQREMEEAQKRLDSEVAMSEERQIEDVRVPVATERFESPKASRDDALGREEKPVGTPKSLHPPAPEQESAKASQEPAVETATEDVSAAPAGVSTVQVLSQPAAMGASPESQRALAPTSTALVENTRTSEGGTVEAKTNLVVSNGPHQEGNEPGRVQPVIHSMVTPPGSQTGVSPMQPLFDEQQLRRFQELHNQAPWLYPGNQMVFPQMQLQPPLARPLFLDQEERRVQGISNAGDQPPVAYPIMVPSTVHENAELRRGLQAVMEENRKLRERVELLENSNLEEPKFSTPNGEDKEAETPNQEAARPPRSSAKPQDLKEAETPHKEAARPPRSSAKPPVLTEAETPQKEADRPPRSFAKPPEEKEAVRPPKVEPDSSEKDNGEVQKDSKVPEASTSSSEEQKTMMTIMLKLMEGMQETHKRLMDGRDETREQESEFVRSAQPLPQLPEWSAMTGPIDLGDWLALIEPMMSDLTGTSGEWWQLLMSEAYGWYQRHLQLPPLDRISHTPTPSPELARSKWSRLEKRASTLLLMAVPEGQREDLISSKRLTALGIICHLLVIYQPGGLAEKELILRSLEQPVETSNLPEAVQSLREWMRWRRRASDLKISEPDPFILLKGLNRIIRKPLENHRDLSFRISLARSTLQVDATPTSSSVTSFALHLLAEFEQVVHQESAQTSKKKVDPDKVKNLKVKKIEEDGGGSPASKREKGGDEKPKCKFYLSDAGCRRGKSCNWSHDQRDDRRRCWNCGSIEHMSPACTRPKTTTETSPPKARQQKIEGEDTSSTASKEDDSKEESLKMKELLEQANTMLKSLTETSTPPTSSTSTAGGETKEEVMDRLQKQLNQLKLKVFKVNQISFGQHQGLVDSGATHPLRPLRLGETDNSYRKVSVTMANGEVTTLQLTPGGVMVSGRQDIEPILPMGHLVKKLGCEVSWKGDGINIRHPMRGLLPVQNQNGCPQLPRGLALELIEELEAMEIQFSSKNLKFEEEKKWMFALVERSIQC